MATTLKSVITLYPQLTIQRDRGATGQLQTFVTEFGKSPVTMLNGTGSGQANRAYDGGALGYISLGVSETKDLTFTGDSSFVDTFGDPINFTKVLGLYLRARTGNVHNIEFGPHPTTNGFLGPFKNPGLQMELVPGQPWATFHPTTGWTVDSTHKVFRLVNTGSTAGQIVELLVWGQA